MSMGNQANYNRGAGPGPGASSSMIILATTLAIIVIIALVFVGAAIGFRNRQPAANVIRVPGDYATIQAAIDAAQPGNIIQVRAGTYSQNLTLNKAVSLIAESFDQVNPANDSTVISGAGGAATISIPAGLTQMPVIRGFVIENGSMGIQAQSEFLAEFNYFHGSGVLTDYELGAGGVNRGNVYFKAGEDAIHVERLNRPLLIENNRILYSGDDGIEMLLQQEIVPASEIEANIWNNMIIGNAEDGIQFIDHPGNAQNSNRRFVVTGNLIANNKRAGIGLMPDGKSAEDYSGADSPEAVRVYNNTFYGNDYGISGGDNLVAFNNVIANAPSRGVWKVQGGPGTNSVVAYTLFFGNRMDTDQSVLGPANILGQDPLFVAAPNPGGDGIWETVDDDFSGLLLQAQSPAIDKGVTQYVASSGEPVPASPITGFLGAAPDLGWREFGSPIFMTSTPSAIPSPTVLVTGTPVTATALSTGTSTAASSATPASPTATAATATAGSPTPASTATSAGTGTSAAGVTIEGLVPNTATAGTTTNITVSGTGFVAGATITFEGGDGPAPQVMLVQVTNSTTLVVTVSLQSDGPSSHVWDIRVTNPDNSTFLLPDAFTVTP